MAEWVTQTDRFLDFNERTLLSGSGSVSASQMKQVAAERYIEFDQHRRALEAERAAEEELDDLRAGVPHFSDAISAPTLAVQRVVCWRWAGGGPVMSSSAAWRESWSISARSPSRRRRLVIHSR